MNVRTLYDGNEHVGIGWLEFTRIPLEFNSTIIQCVGTLDPGEASSSQEVLLQVQGNCEWLPIHLSNMLCSSLLLRGDQTLIRAFLLRTFQLVYSVTILNTPHTHKAG